MKRFVFSIIVALFCFAFGVAATLLVFFSPNKEIEQRQQSQILTFVNNEIPKVESFKSSQELKIPDLTNARVFSVKKDRNSNASVEMLTGVSEKADFSNCHNYESIRKWNGTNPDNLYINRILRFSVDKQVWLYKISASPPSVAVIFQFDYIDEDGDGKFDKCAESNSTKAFKMPPWARAKLRKSVSIKSKR
jgi:hypothetical protein